MTLEVTLKQGGEKRYFYLCQDSEGTNAFKELNSTSYESQNTQLLEVRRTRA